MSGFSIPAAEHSTITSWGRDGEPAAFENMLDSFPKGLVACVSDSYDIFNACENIYGKQLKAKILARDGCLVVRPDSGELPGVVTDVLDSLAKAFDTEKTSTGHKLLPPQLRVIQGDGINIGSLESILNHMAEKGWAADNLAFGSGGALLQKLHRDTLKFAFKCSFVQVNGQARDVWKDPVTDPGKASKRGRLRLVKAADGSMKTECGSTTGPDLLCEVFRNGHLLVDQTLGGIRERAAI